MRVLLAVFVLLAAAGGAFAYIQSEPDWYVRLRYPLEVLRAVREVWPKDKPLSVRVSATDWHDKGFTGDDAVLLGRALKENGCDIVDVSTGQTSMYAVPVYGRMYQTPFSDRIRNEAGIPTMTVGNITTPDQVNTILIQGGDRAESKLRSAVRLSDIGIRVAAIADPPAVAIENASGVVPEPLERAVAGAASAAGLQPTPFFTYLANTIRKGDRAVPYSLVTATDLSQLGSPAPAASPGAGGAVPPIVVFEPAVNTMPAPKLPSPTSPADVVPT